MKKLKSMLATLVMLLCTISASAHDFEVDGIYYNITDSEKLTVAVTYRGIINYNSYSNRYTGDVVIPETVTYESKTYAVTSIGREAFYKCSSLTSVTIGDGVTSIGSYAFYNCSSLTSVTIGDGVTSIGSSAFEGCSSLTSVHISDIAAWCNIKFDYYSNHYSNPLYYANHLYMNGKEITELIIPNGVSSIGSYAFYNCSSLTSVTIPNSVTSIGYSAFDGCSSLNTMVVGTGVLSIGNNQSTPVKTIWLTNTPPSGYSNLTGKINYVANEQYGSMSNMKVYKYLSSMFEVDGITYVPVNPSERTCDVIDCNYDSTLTDIKINETVSYKNIAMKVNEIMPYTFYVNKYIKSISLNNNGGIGNYAFYNCESLTTATLGDSIKSLDDYTFSGCMQLKEIIIPNAVKRIGEYCFENCSNLTEISIPKSTTRIYDYAFSGCI